MATVLSLLVFTAIALLGGAAFLWRRPSHRRQAILMLILAAVVAANVAIWTLPTGNGAALLDQASK